MRSAFSFFTMLLLLGCSGTGYLVPEQYDFDNSVVVESDFDTAWGRLINWFSETGNQIKNLDKSSGFIATEEIAFSSEYCDCGTLSGIYSVPVLENVGSHNAIGTMNVLLTKLGDDKTKVTVNLRASYVMTGAYGGSKRYECVSKGLIESSIFAYLAGPSQE